MNVEQVIYSNLAKLIAHEIEQTHRTSFTDQVTVFARDAYLPPKAAGADPNEQTVVLRSPLIVTYAAPPGGPSGTSRRRTSGRARRRRRDSSRTPTDGSATLTLSLSDGVVFPRTVVGAKASQGGAAAASFGPLAIPSRVGEKTKFLDVFKLKQLQADPSRGQEVQQALAQFIRADQASAVADRVAADLRGPGPAGRAAVPGRPAGPDRAARGDGGGGPAGTTACSCCPRRPETNGSSSGSRAAGRVRLTAEGHGCRVKVAVPAGQEADATVTVSMRDAVVDANDAPGEDADVPVPAPLDKQYAVPLSDDVAAMSKRTAEQYLADRVGTVSSQRKLRFAWFDLTNHISSELNARAAFVVSCLLLVLVGSSLGMMFRSGNFLTAFAVSVVPAMLSVVLIVTGQHTAESTPTVVAAGNNPLHLGLALIWSGNVAVGIAAVVLLARLQRR